MNMLNPETLQKMKDVISEIKTIAIEQEGVTDKGKLYKYIVDFFKLGVDKEVFGKIMYDMERP